MADIAQILLPPPTPPLQRLPARESELAVNAEVQGGGDTARAKRFRFRVYEGGESGEANTDVATRRTDSRGRATLDRAGSTEDATGQSSSRRIRASSGDSRTGPSSAFLAQAFAQEQLGEGLHNPPFAAATQAYTRTGAALSAPASAGVNISV
ncbi:hypothetical protein [Dongia sedimenti]|uniref:Uncharacterized protein n=1 Tax=Dongia sedimenti TaxID=3064282 RepID=A0ABU0YN51_9PROT|nr:hypothetical protein [Rhodospirillaceae bacterium R-7]